MARKKVDEKAAKEKKQKKIAAVGAVLLVALMAFQVPRTMKMLNSNQPVEEAAAQTAPAPATPAPAAGAAPLDPPTLSGANPSAPGAAPSGGPVAVSGQLVSFGRFASKDPFVQQVSDAAGKPAVGEEAPEEATGPKQPDQGIGADPAPDDGPALPGAGGEATAPTSAQISVDGVAETVQKDGSFPAAAPMFVLKSLGKKTATIGVADGGSFAAGDAMLKLEVGEPVTLVNTADGTRFVLELKSVG